VVRLTASVWRNHGGLSCRASEHDGEQQVLQLPSHHSSRLFGQRTKLLVFSFSSFAHPDPGELWQDALPAYDPFFFTTDYN
jgi:hypothetical protein